VKTLYLLRHAKSSWDDPSQADFDRPLTGRGRRTAAAMGRYLAAAGTRPDLVLCSAARRTRETLDIVQAAWGWRVPTEIEDRLYETTRNRLLARLKEVEDHVGTVLLIGHNPGMEELAAYLADPAASDGEALARLRTKYPTGALAVLAAPIKRWQDLGRSAVRLTTFVVPRDLERQAGAE
jgi:phosphohistidine phosphatase